MNCLGNNALWHKIDFGGVPFDKIEKNIELATEILPAIRNIQQNNLEKNTESLIDSRYFFMY